MLLGLYENPKLDTETMNLRVLCLKLYLYMYPMIDTKMTKLLLFFENDINLLFDLAQMAVILDLPPF